MNSEKKPNELLVGRYVFNDFPTKIKIADAPKPIYYHKDRSKVPKSILKEIGDFYEWDDDNYLRVIDGKRIVKNQEDINKGGTFLTINGNLLFEKVSPMVAMKRASHIEKIKKDLTDYFRKNITKLEIKESDYPLTIYFEYHVKSANIDVDNFSIFYQKCFLDAFKTWYLKGAEKQIINNPNGSIPEDNPNYVNRVSHRILVKENLKNCENRLYVSISKNNLTTYKNE